MNQNRNITNVTMAMCEGFRDYKEQIWELEERIDTLEDNISDSWMFDDEEIEGFKQEKEELEIKLNELKSKQKEEYLNELKDLPPETDKRDFEGFRTDETDPPFWSSFIPGNKDRDYMMNKYGYTLSYIAEVTPDEYLMLCGKYAWKRIYTDVKQIEDSMGEEDLKNIHEMAELMKQGQKFGLPYVDILKSGQEGRHRALAAKEAGIKTIPCLIIA